MIAAFRTGRNSIGVEVDREYCRIAARRLKNETGTLFSRARLFSEKAEQTAEGSMQIREEPEMYQVRKRPRRSAKA
jgi:hypothetical protein